MSDFDFDVLEAEMHDPEGERLRDVAAAHWLDARVEQERDFLVQATDLIEEILGVSNGADVKVVVPDLNGNGGVEMTIDGMRFQVKFSSFKDTDPILNVRLRGVTTASWTCITSLAELGCKIASGQVVPVDPVGQ